MFVIAKRIDRQGYGKYPSHFRVPILIVGGIMTPFVIMTYIVGISMTSGIHASLFAPSYPVLVCLFSVLAGHERFSLVKFGTILITVFGCLVLVFWDMSTGDDPIRGSNVLVGSILLFLNQAVSAVMLITRYVSLVVRVWWNRKAMVAVISPTYLNAMFFRLATVPIVLAGCVSWYMLGNDIFVPLYNSRYILVWSAILYFALISTCYTWPANSYAMRHSNPTMVAAMSPLQPVMTVILSMVLLGETPTVGQTIGAVIIVIGYVVTVYSIYCLVYGACWSLNRQRSPSHRSRWSRRWLRWRTSLYHQVKCLDLMPIVSLLLNKLIQFTPFH